MLTAGAVGRPIPGEPAGTAGAAPCDHPRTMRRVSTPGVQALLIELGLGRPPGAAAAWLRDRHLVAAVLVALPVWAALGATVGMRMQVPIGVTGWLLFAVVQPLAEELAFRGALQGRLLALTAARRAGPITWANAATTVFFVAWHATTQPLGWALAVALPSLVFGHLRDRSGSVLPAMLVHIVYNAGFALTAWWVQH
jgi:membrane protease YdiL (CAAX protease family)